ncbi:hypothetical protein [uncultured Imperialibacter sp.]|uniref:hypothetical protein n=1 Tax=uncultured Imperialibacter sp. TaxID=1672639 RepID=UPI0030D8C5D4
MHKHIFTQYVFFCVAMWHSCAAFGQIALPVDDRKIVLIKGIKTDGTEVAGFLLDLDKENGLLHFQQRDELLVEELRAEEIDRIAYFKKGSFWRGFGWGALVGESLWATYVFSNEPGYFGRGFDLVVGSVLFVTPVGIVAGIVDGAKGVHLDYEVEGDKAAFQLPIDRLTRFTNQDVHLIRPSEKGKRRLRNYSFTETPIARRHPQYSPRFHFGLSYGLGLTGMVRKIEKNYSPLQFDSRYGDSRRGHDGIFRIGVSYSLSDTLEVGYDFQNEYGDVVNLYGSRNGYEIRTSVYMFQSSHKLYGMYHIKPYYSAVGTPFQLSAGAGLIFSNTYLATETYGSSSFPDVFVYDEARRTTIVPGLALMAKASYFINPNLSVQLLLEQDVYTRASTTGLSLGEPVNYTTKPLRIAPNLFSIATGLRFHL